MLFEGGNVGQVNGGSATGAIETAGDTDWFSVILSAGGSYRIDLRWASTSDGTLVNPYLHGVYSYAEELPDTRRNGGGRV